MESPKLSGEITLVDRITQAELLGADDERGWARNESVGDKLMKMKIFYKMTLVLVAAMTVATSAFAGGTLTNSNQSASFLRSIARGTSLDPDAVYNNPAGVVFMANGFHLGLG